MADQRKQKPAVEEMLLDLHLDRLDPEQRQRLNHALDADDDLAAKHARLGRVLRPLDAWTVPAPPPDLANRILDRVSTARGLRITPPDSPTAARHVVGPGLSLRELVAIAACIAIFVGILVPGVSRMQAANRRAVCASNLRSIYGGVSAYAATFNNQLPNIAGMVPGASWLPTTRRDVPQVSNGRNRYVLIRLRLVVPQAFVCPSRAQDSPMSGDHLTAQDDFSSARHCSYDSLNMAGPTPRFDVDRALPIYGDANPLFDDAATPAVHNPDSNSRSHGGAGQNVLWLDGNVRWCTTPLVGVDGDNIWQAGNIRTYTGTEVQTTATDAFLIP